MQPPDLKKLGEQVSQTILSRESPQQQIQQLLQQTVGLVNGAGAVLFSKDTGVLQVSSQLLSQQATRMSPDILTECSASAEKALLDKSACFTPLELMPSTFVISCAVPGPEDFQQACLSVIVVLGDTPREPFLVIIQLLAVLIAERLWPEKGSKTGLLSRVSESWDTLSLQGLRDILRQWFGCNLLAFGSGQRGERVRLESISDVVTVNQKTAQARLFTKVMQDCLQHNNPVLWPALSPDSAFKESLLLKELVQTSGMRRGLVVPMPGGNGSSTIVVILWTTSEQCPNQISEFLSLAPLLGLLLQFLSTNKSAHKPTHSSPRKALKKTALLLILATILAGTAFYPVPFSLHPDCRTAPVQVHYTVARFDGFLKKVFVEPGDLVEEDTQLVLLDGRELDLELRSIEADSAKALKLRDNHLATGNAAAAQIGLLEYKRLQERAGLISMRQQQLSLRSPVEGIVLSGDIKRAERGPVTKGQVLFEIAPLDTVLIELAIADADISYVQQQAPVIVHFDAFPGRSWHGEIEKISPKSELLQGENVFIVSFKAVNDERLLQPGMLGQASVECDKKSLIWIYFHKPWYALIRLLRSLI